MSPEPAAVVLALRVTWVALLIDAIVWPPTMPVPLTRMPTARFAVLLKPVMTFWPVVHVPPSPVTSGETTPPLGALNTSAPPPGGVERGGDEREVAVGGVAGAGISQSGAGEEFDGGVGQQGLTQGVGHAADIGDGIDRQGAAVDRRHAGVGVRAGEDPRAGAGLGEGGDTAGAFNNLAGERVVAGVGAAEGKRVGGGGAANRQVALDRDGIGGVGGVVVEFSKGTF